MAEGGVFSQNQFPRGRGVPNENPAARFVIDTEKQRIVVKFGKKVTARDIAQYADRLRADPLFRPNFSEIVDLTGVEDLDLQADEFLKLADEVDPFSDDAKRAFVVSNPVQHHAARMHMALRGRQNIAIFSSLAEAQRWVG